MPFLPPNQQRQSTEGSILLLLLLLVLEQIQLQQQQQPLLHLFNGLSAPQDSLGKPDKCKQSACHSREITTPTPHHSIFMGHMLGFAQVVLEKRSLSGCSSSVEWMTTYRVRDPVDIDSICDQIPHSLSVTKPTRFPEFLLLCNSQAHHYTTQTPAWNLHTHTIFFLVNSIVHKLGYGTSADGSSKM